MQWAFNFYDQNADGIIDITDIFNISTEIYIEDPDLVPDESDKNVIPSFEYTISKYARLKPPVLATPAFMSEIRTMIDDYMNRIVKMTPGLVKRPINLGAFREMFKESCLANEMYNKLNGDTAQSLLVQMSEKKELKKEVKAKQNLKRIGKRELAVIKE